MTELFSHPDFATGNPEDEALPMVEYPDELAAVALAAKELEQHQAVPAPLQPPDGAPPAPVPIVAGTYAVYDDGQGGIVLTLGQANGDTVQKHIPAAMIKMAEKFGGMSGGLGGLFGKF